MDTHLWSRSGQFVDGKYRDGTSGEQLRVRNPATGEVLATFPSASPADVDAAVVSARHAFTEWSATTPAKRAALLTALATRLEELAEDLATTESLQTGKPLRLTREFDVPGTIDNVAFFASTARHLEGKAAAEYTGDHTSMVRREPIGVIGSIAPWNYPLQMAGWKMLPAVAAGNTIVLKPAELTPLTALMLAQAASDVGFPPGVVNVVNGDGPTVGEALTGHPDVEMVSFTGSTDVGRRVAAVAAGKRLHLELGGKAPFVVFADADLEAACHGAVAGALINSGQDCTAATRAYVQRPIYENFVARTADLMSRVRVGDPSDPGTDLGPLVSAGQRQRVAEFVRRARSAGAQVVCGGDEAAIASHAAPYFPPTLITGAAQDSEIVQCEIFGPVLVVLPFDTDDEAFTLANDTGYGLAASVWTRDHYRAQRASRVIRAGCVWINDHIPMASEMPHGGWKASGFGKDMSTYSFDEYTNIKHVMSDITGIARKDWHRTVFALD